LLGADLKKDPAILEAAYNDALGVTSAFNLNVLARINRELKGTFDLRAFRHRAFYNERQADRDLHREFVEPARADREARSRDRVCGGRVDSHGELLQVRHGRIRELAAQTALSSRARGSTRRNASAVICCSPTDQHDEWKTTLVQFHNVTYSLPNATIISDLNLTVERGETLVLLGESAAARRRRSSSSIVC
jgi:ABC-type multidrug transport system fused ATPase/permease subunit